MKWTEVIAVKKGRDDKHLLSDQVDDSCKMKYIVSNAYTFRTTKSPEMDDGSQMPASLRFPLGAGPWTDTSIDRVLT